MRASHEEERDDEEEADDQQLELLTASQADLAGLRACATHGVRRCEEV